MSTIDKIEEVGHDRTAIDKRKTRKRIRIIALSSIVLVAIVVAAVVGASQTERSKDDNNNNNNGQSLSSSVKAICSVTLYPDSCYSSLAPKVKSGDIKPQDLYSLSVQVAMDELSNASSTFVQNGLKKLNVTDPKALAAVRSCRELFHLALDHLNDSMSVTDANKDVFYDLQTWLSSSQTYVQTCIDDMALVNENLTALLQDAFKNAMVYNSNSLAIVKSMGDSVDALGGLIGKSRRLMMMGADEDGPSWLSVKDRKLLQASTSTIKADAVVAKDGSGKYKTISAALKAVPKKSKKRFVIYVKRGLYFEHVIVDKTTWNVAMIGDGKDATVVSGNLNVVDGTPTFKTASFSVLGKGFMARDMGFANTAGPAKHQAVALRSSSDLSVFYRCKMSGFQDTLYVHANRQFYRECDIYGTVDFIFGNSPCVIQNSNIFPKRPLPGQQNTVTAQGKFDPNQNTGIAIQNCNVQPAENLRGVNTYLGRPWKDYSTTIFFESVLGGLISPQGWLPWVGSTAPKTIFYAEYRNTGPGAGTKNRVRWTGLKLNLGPAQVGKFTVGPFLNGNSWIPGTGVPFKAGL